MRNKVKKSIALVKAFPTLTDNAKMVDFWVPEQLGIGLARDSATVIKSGEKTLAYTGRTLNLAARLMDVARPRGVVFDASFGIDEYRKFPILAPARDSDETATISAAVVKERVAFPWGIGYTPIESDGSNVQTKTARLRRLRR